jgi:hypothetical protein
LRGRKVPPSINVMEESMGYERTSKDIRSADVHAAITGKPKNVVARQASSSQIVAPYTTTSGAATDVWRQARQMRDEWRKNRYARLKG